MDRLPKEITVSYGGIGREKKLAKVSQRARGGEEREERTNEKERSFFLRERGLGIQEELVLEFSWECREGRQQPTGLE